MTGFPTAAANGTPAAFIDKFMWLQAAFGNPCGKIGRISKDFHRSMYKKNLFSSEPVKTQQHEKLEGVIERMY